MNQAIIDAFIEIRTTQSPDAVIADPELDERFLAACRAKGVRDSAETVNKALLNARKAGFLKDIKSKRVIVKN